MQSIVSAAQDCIRELLRSQPALSADPEETYGVLT